MATRRKKQTRTAQRRPVKAKARTAAKRRTTRAVKAAPAAPETPGAGQGEGEAKPQEG
jgi:hypothetical protein